ncbi:hypothetical protein LTR37_014062 [Vermiconidia calcicola]|uniref:Uncharacterized protein n=1 Tax=Vermiconidia calcicola TaxID=1690605 RepID=A0ACC3MVC2_9PEZI|nr:hypothetical protein LTR37_014062 [Vermiconidia calcicola]
MLQPSIARNPLALRKLLELCMQTGKFPLNHFLNCKLNRMKLRSGKTTKPFDGRQRTRGPRLATFDTPVANARPSAGTGRQRRPETRANKANRITKWPRDIKHTEPRGLQNPSIMCYRNALLQCLLHLPAFCGHLRAVHQECPLPVEECAVCALQELEQKYWGDRTSADFPREPDERGGAIATFDEAFSSCCPEGNQYYEMATGWRQEDPHEFLLFLHSELSAVEHHKSNRLDRLFMFKQVARWTCEHCNADCHAKNDNACMELGVQKPKQTVSLMDLIRRYHTDSRDWYCTEPGCEAERQLRREAGMDEEEIKRRKKLLMDFKISQAPEVLCIELKRSGFGGTNKKIKDDIPYDEELDMTEFTEDESELKYRLFSVVAHSGPSPKSGHHIAAVRKREKGFQTISDLDREELETPDFYELRYPSFEKRTFDPVLLFYSRTA